LLTRHHLIEFAKIMLKIYIRSFMSADALRRVCCVLRMGGLSTTALTAEEILRSLSNCP
jgi:hypothetical protein